VKREEPEDDDQYEGKGWK